MSTVVSSSHHEIVTSRLVGINSTWKLVEYYIRPVKVLHFRNNMDDNISLVRLDTLSVT